MTRFIAFALALASAALVSLLPASAQATDRTLPMRFDLRLQGPADTCGAQCRLWISASGAITADTPRDFESFAQGRDLTGATVVLDSDGGSVLGAIALGSDIRRRGLDTTVGRIVDVPSGQERPRGRYVPRADCESMCGFVLLGGVHRAVPPEARVMVHQIWLGDRRDDPTAANYTAEDLVLVQRDIGRLARYTIDMGGSIDLLNLALRIPPWEPMHALTADETRRTRLATDQPDAPVAATVAASPGPAPAATRPVPRVTDGARATAISERRWAMVDRDGVTALARRQPLTVEGEDIGSFDLMLACGTAGGDSYDVSYVERRHNGDRIQVPAELGAVTLTVGRMSASLKVVSSERRSQPDELVTYAAGTVPAALVGAFAAVGNHSMLIETTSSGMVTGIRFGNTGAQQNLPRLTAACVKEIGDRADLSPQKTGGLASAK
ncbi:MAG TPA: hypothetical protein VFC32_11285 [Pseudolabrys sp.]|nr:hypothetical protein [Pseudolabrys sp.]